jgi:hypothetical protein
LDLHIHNWDPFSIFALIISGLIAAFGSGKRPRFSTCLAWAVHTAQARERSNTAENRILKASISVFQIIQVVSGIMTISALWEFGMNPCRMGGAMAVTALWYSFVFVGMALNTAYIMVLCC